MAKPLTCNKYVARGIKKYGLREVQAAVEMAIELSGPDTTPALKRSTKPKKTSDTGFMHNISMTPVKGRLLDPALDPALAAESK